MVAIVSGNSLGLNLTSHRTLGTPLGGQAVHGRNGEAAYVNIANGNLVLQRAEDVFAARGVDAIALRTYNSQGLFNDDNGDNWSTGFVAQPLQLSGTLNAAGSTLTRTDRDGSRATYAFDTTSATYRSTEGSGAHDTIRLVASAGELEWREGSSGTTQRYQASGAFRLLSTADATGYRVTYAYDAQGRISSETTGNGETRQYAYTAAGNLYRIVSSAADGSPLAYLQFLYDASNRLVKAVIDHTPQDFDVSDFNRYVTDYEYDGTSKRIASITQSDGTKASFTYVDVGGGVFKVASVRDALNQATTFTYGQNYSTVTDALGLVTRYEFDAAGQVTRISAPPTAGASATRIFAYSASGDVLSFTDGMGRTTTFAYDAQGNQVLQRDAMGNTVRRSFDAANRLLSESAYLQADPDGAGPGAALGAITRRYVYEAGARGLLRFSVTAEGGVTEHRYNAMGDRVSTIVYAAAEYPVDSLGPAEHPDETALAAWASAQDLTRTLRTDMTHDARGQMRTRATYSAVDAAGTGVGAGSVEHFIRDASGRLLQVISPAQGTTHYTHDGLGRVLTTTNALGQVTVTQYDDAGRRSIVVGANGLVTTSAYDLAGRLVSVSQSGPASSPLGETKFFYDAADRLRMTQDPTGVRQWILYDEEGRKVADIDGNGTLVEYGYDRDGRLLASTTYATAVNTSLLCDAAGSPVLDLTLAAVRPASTGSDLQTWNAYDGAGRLVRTARTVGTAGQASVTETSYDGASRPVRVTQYATLVAVASLAAGSIPQPAPAPGDRVTRSFFDADGRLVGTLDAEGYLTTHAYDQAGRAVHQMQYASVTPAALRASGTLAQLVPAGAADDIQRFTYYDGRGLRIAEVDGEGYLTEWTHDADGNLTQTVRYAARVAQTPAVTSTVGSIRPEPSAADQASVRGYDLLGRLVRETSHDGTVTTYAYSAAGQLVSTVRAANTADERTLLAKHDLLGRLVAELAPEGAALLTGGQTQAQVDAIWAQYAQTHTYDAAGRRTSTTDAAGHTRWHYYDADGALRYTINALGEVQERRYDGVGRLAQEIAYATRSGVRRPGGLIAGNLSVTSDPAQDSVTTYSYTRDGRIASVVDAESNATTFQHNAFGEEVGSTQALSAGLSLTEVHTVDRRGLRTSTLLDPAGVAALQSTEYDAFGRVVRSVDANGNARLQQFDRLGRIVVSRDALGGSRTTAYDAFDRKLAHTDALGHVTAFSYDAATRTVAMTTAGGVQTSTAYSRHGEVQAITDGRGNVTTYTYDRSGRLVGTSTPLTSESTTYDAAGRIVESRDAAGRRVTYTYDAASRVLTRTVDPGGLALVTQFSYDGKGQRVTVTDANGGVTRYAFDRKGRIASETVDPGGLNLRTTYTHDAAGRTLTVITPGGTRTEYVYDALGRRTLERVDPTGLDLRRSWVYDDQGNVVASRDAIGHVTRHAYDAAGRLVFTVDPLGGTVQRSYDAEGRLVRTTRYATPIALDGLPEAPTAAAVQARVVAGAADAVEHQVHDKDGRVTATVDGAGGVVRYAYDAAGNVVQRTAYANRIDVAAWVPGSVPSPATDAARDQRTTSVYDALNRAIYRMDGTGAVVAQRYDGNGELLERTAFARAVPLDTPATAEGMASALLVVAAPGRDVRVRNSYDAAGRLAASVDGVGAVVRYVYDRNGNVLQQAAIATPVGDSTDPLTAASSSADRITRYAYDAANRQVVSVNAEGAATRRTYDAEGRTVALTAYATRLEGAALAAWTGNAPALSPSVDDRTTSYAYDAAGRLVYEVDAMRQVRRSSYDANGRVVETRRFEQALSPNVSTQAAAITAALVTRAADRWEQHSYDAGGRRTSTRDALGGEESWTYDALGNKASFRNKKGAVWTYGYDAAGRLVRETSPQLSVTSTSFGAAQGTVVEGATQPANVVTLLQYDGVGQLTHRTEASGRTEERVTRYDYDAAGRQVRVIHPEVGVYDAASDNPLANDGVSARRDVQARALETRTYYDALGNAVANRDIGGGLSQKVYDRAGRVIFEVDAAGYVTGYVRDAFGGATSLTRYGTRTQLAERGIGTAAHATTRAEIEGVLGAASFSHASDRILRSAYDKAGRVTDTWQPAAFMFDAVLGVQDPSASARTQQRYNAFGEVAQVRQARNAAATIWYETTHYFDVLGREKAVVDAMGHATTTRFDAFGNVEGATEFANPLPAGSWSIAAYGQPQVSTADRTVSYAYDNLDRKVAETRLNVEHSTRSDGTSIVGNLVTTYGYDALGNQTRVTDASGESTFTTFDALGRITAVATPLGTGNQSKSVTEFRRDAHGNVVVQVARGTPVAASATGHAAAVAGTDDRQTLTRYDALGHALEVTDPNGSTLFTSYDASGRVAKTWRGVTDADGGVRTQFQLNVYDALGQLVETLTPASTTVVQGGVHASYTPPINHGYEYTAPGRLTLQWSNIVDPSGGSVRIEADYVVTTEVLKYVWGGEVLVPETRTLTATRDYAAGTAAAGGELSWTEKTDRVSAIRVLQFADGQWRVRWEGSLASASGSGVNVLSQAEAGFVSTSQEFNAFGEMTRKGTQGGRQEYFEYDAAGRLWRTNAGDGVDRVHLHDLQGNVTAEIRSSGAGSANQDVRAYLDAQHANGDAYSRRVDVKYNALGHVSSRTEASRMETRGGAIVQRQFVAASVTSAVPIGDLQTASAWSGMNEVRLGWNSLGVLGNGDLRVEITYKTPMRKHGGTYDAEFGFTSPVTYTGGITRTYFSGLLQGDQHATGVTLRWAETSGTVDGGGIGQVAGVKVEKKDIHGNWVVVIEQAPGYGANELLIATPEDPQSRVTLHTRMPGGSWHLAPDSALAAFGNYYRCNVSSWGAGTYEYQVTTTPQGGSGQVTASGSVSVTQSLLSAIPVPITMASAPAGKLYWAHQDFATQQVMRYRPVGGGSWQDLPVKVFGFNSDLDGVDTAHLAAGTYQYELLWTPAGQSSPTQHSIGTFTVTEGQAAYTIPASGLPNITGVSLGTIEIPGYMYGGDEANSYYTPSTFVPAIYWDACGATLARATPNGSTWYYLTIDNLQQHRDPYVDVYSGKQRAALTQLPPNQYNIEIYANGKWATAYYVSTGTRSLTVTTPAYVPAQYVPAKPRTYSVSPNTPAWSHALSTTEGRAASSQSAWALGNSSYRPVVNQNTDRWGNVVSISDPRSANWVTTYRFNANNQVVRQTLPSAPNVGAASTDIYYDALGRQLAVKDANGYVNGTVYDAAGNAMEQRQADGGVVRHVYDAFGQRTQTTDGDGRVVRFSYDRMGNVLAVEKGAVPLYTSVGETVQWAGMVAIKDQWTYDQLGQRLKFINGNGEILTYGYDLRGNVVETRQPMGQRTQSAFDAQGRKIAELDANGFASHWTYDYFGRLTGHTDLGGARYTYGFDHARQLTLQKNTRGQNLQYAYDAAGQLTRIHDAAINQATSYTYDASGRHIRERVVQNGTTYQDNHLAYDEVGHLRSVADARVSIRMDYDKVGNRTKVATTVGYEGVAGEVAPVTKTRYFLYDGMHRQIVVDGINEAGAIGTDQGHQITYDKSGNRTSDTSWGTRVTATTDASPILYYNDSSDGTAVHRNDLSFTKSDGLKTEAYRYDAANRLQSIVRNGVMVDHRRYDGADRLLFSGPTVLPAGYVAASKAGLQPDASDGLEQTYNRYDANGRLVHQRTLNSDGSARSTVTWDTQADLGAGMRAAGYDNVGNVKGYVARDMKSGVVAEYTTTFKRFEGHQADVTTGRSTVRGPGSTTQGYDTNGFLVSVRDSTMSANNRDFVNDSAGRALFVKQGAHVQRQLIANGEVLALYGAGINEKEPRKPDGNPNFANVTDFELGYAPITSTYPNASPGTYVVRTSDTLQSIAQSAYGDSALWYRIAEANGLVTSTDLKVGQTLNIPNRVGTIHNNKTTFEPYDPSKITGDMTPNLPMPKEGCGGLGQLLIVIVAVVVTIYTAGAMSGVATGFSQTMSAGIGVLAAPTGAVTSAIGAKAAAAVAVGTLGTTGTLAVAAAAGAFASQVVGGVTGNVSDLDWKGIALSALSAGVSAGITPHLLPNALTPGVRAIAQAAVTGTLTQGIGVALGLQRKFDWRGVAASAIGAGVGEVVGAHLNGIWGASWSGALAARAVTGLVAGSAVAIARGGKVEIQQVAVDAFGNALGQSLGSASDFDSTRNPSSADYANEMDRLSDAAYTFRSQADFSRTSGDFARMDGASYRNMAYEQEVAGRGLHFGRGSLGVKFSAADIEDWGDQIRGGAALRAMRDSEIDAMATAENAKRDAVPRQRPPQAGAPTPGTAAGSAIVPPSHPSGSGGVLPSGWNMRDAHAANIAAAPPLVSNPGTFNRGFSGEYRSVLEGDALGWETAGRYAGAAVDSLKKFAYAASGARAMDAAIASWRAGNQGTAVLQGLTAFGDAGLTALTAGEFGLFKAAAVVDSAAGRAGTLASEGIVNVAARFRSVGLPDWNIGLRYELGAVYSNPLPIAFSRVESAAAGPVRSGEITTFKDFVDRSVVGDMLEGHELWQHANLRANGLVTSRLATAASRDNPVIALEQSLHKEVNVAQRALNPAMQTPVENIRANAEILRVQGSLPEALISEAERRAIAHARALGFLK
jgi:YD repeat-containing protein